jgi:aminoglycoside 6'-N-acetyltransferase I
MTPDEFCSIDHRLMEMVVRPPQPEDREEWTRMRAALWPESSAESHAEEIPVFVAARPGGGLCGFLEASVRPMADGCTTHPVGYVEGWYVEPDVRRRGIGRALLKAAEGWALSQGCQEMASDAHLDNSVSRAAHKAAGFMEEPPCVRLRKWLAAQAASP